MHYGQSNVSTDLSNVNSLSAMLSAEAGADLAISGNQTINLAGCTSDASGNVQLNTNASSFPNAAFQGIILAPNNAISLVNANLNGRAFGGDSQDMQIVSATSITDRSGRDLAQGDSEKEDSAPVTAVEAAVLDGFGEVLGGHRLGSVQVGDRTGDLEDAVVRASA